MIFRKQNVESVDQEGSDQWCKILIKMVYGTCAFAPCFSLSSILLSRMIMLTLIHFYGFKNLSCEYPSIYSFFFSVGDDLLF